MDAPNEAGKANEANEASKANGLHQVKNIRQYVADRAIEHVSRSDNKIMMLETELRRLNNRVVQCSTRDNILIQGCFQTLRLKEAYETCSRPYCITCRQLYKQ